MSYSTRDSKNKVDSSRSKFLPKTIKLPTSKHPRNDRNESTAIPVSHTRTSSAIQDICKSSPFSSSNGGSKWIIDSSSVSGESAKLDTFGNRIPSQEKVIKIEERLSYIAHIACHLTFMVIMPSFICFFLSGLLQELALSSNLDLEVMTVKVVLIDNRIHYRLSHLAISCVLNCCSWNLWHSKLFFFQLIIVVLSFLPLKTLERNLVVPCLKRKVDCALTSRVFTQL